MLEKSHIKAKVDTAIQLREYLLASDNLTLPVFLVLILLASR